MTKKSDSLLLVDNQNVMTILNEGEFVISSLTFEEAKAIIDLHREDEIIRCFSSYNLEEIVFDYLKVEKKDFLYKHIADMRVGQDAIAFKLYISPSKSQPIVITPIGSQAKKIQNIYVYCQLISRVK